MEISTVIEILRIILLCSCSVTVLSWGLVGVTALIHYRNRERREMAAARREAAYHKKRMKSDVQ